MAAPLPTRGRATARPRYLIALRRTAHYAVYLLAGALIVLSALALALRVWLLPHIDHYRPVLERRLALATGVDVRIDHVAAEWQGLQPTVILRGVRFSTGEAAALLTLPRLQATLSWLSLLRLEPRFAAIDLDRPHLVVARDAYGVVHVAGIPVNTEGAPSALPDWLLRQPRLRVRDATVVWRDERLAAPPLTLSAIEFVLVNRFGRHRLALTARPPVAVAQWLDVRADFRGRSIARLQDFAGQFYVFAQGAQSAALRTWAPWAQAAVRSGEGTLRLWLDFSRRRIDAVMGDVRLRQVRLGPSANLPEVAFERIEGRLGWRRARTGEDYFVEGLSFVSPQGHTAAPASLRLHLGRRTDAGYEQLKVESDPLQLEALTALTGSVPFPQHIHDLIEAHAPRGVLQRLRLHWRRGGEFALEARLRDVSLRAAGDIPGFGGLSGEITATDHGGRARLEGRRFSFDAPKIFRHTLAFDTLQAQLSWQRRADAAIEVRISALQLSNADVQGSAGGRLLWRKGAAPEVDLTARLQRALGNAVWRYLPHAVSDDAYDWLRRGIRAGLSDDTRLILRGPLDRFPFHQGGGQFRVDVAVRDAVVDVAPGWPRFSAVNGRLVFRDTALELELERAAVEGIGGIELTGIRGLIPDLHFTQDEMLHIEGRARGPTAAFLDYIRASPVHDYTGRFTEQMRAEGQGLLALRLNLPLRRIDDSTVSGVYRILDNRLDPGRDLPVLEHLKGDLAFTHRDIHARALSAFLFGQPAALALHSAPGGRVLLTLNGRITPEPLTRWLPQGLVQRLSGSATYRAELTLHPQHTDLRVDSDLRGLAIDLPAPLGKTAQQTKNLSIVHLQGDAGRAELTLRYGEYVSLRARLPTNAAEPAAIAVAIGQNEAPAAREPGVRLAIAQTRLDLDPWLALLEGPSQRGLPWLGMTLVAGELTVLHRRISNAQISARPDDAGWQVQIASREVQGELHWQGGSTPALLRGRFRRLELPQAVSGGQSTSARRLTFALDVQADSFLLGGRELGGLQLAAQPEAQGLRLINLRLVNPDARLEASGLIAADPRGASRIELRLDSGNLNGLLTRLGYPGNVRRGEGSLGGHLTWPGGLAEFSLDRLGGELDVRLTKGQFLKLDPGAGRLLGVLSLQALPRRIALDFRDVFSEGFAFDELTAPIKLGQGVMQVAELKMRGPAASVTLRGSIDLVRETQDLRVSVQPRLEETIAAGAMLVNPAVGVGALVAGKVLKDPISRAVSFEYQVRGSWAEPEVTRLPRPRAAAEDAPQ
ncbi:MAG: YhdP family protein [Thiobacillaceae bacterium]|nr:YhdP family protein [Thiobacillaceae bacterium]MDW8322547.1 YhdP family protein [Burkholderiales bacterium]